MHIGIVTSEFPPDIGGVETYTIEFAKALISLGYEVTVFVHSRHASIDIPNIRVCPVLKFSKRLDSIILKQYSVDAWHVMNAAHSWLTLATDKPVVVSIHGNDFLNPYPLVGNPGLSQIELLWRLAKILGPLDKLVGKYMTPILMRKALPFARIILSNSRYTETVFLNKFPACKGKTRVAQVGVSQDFLDMALVKKANPIPQLLTVSRLSELRKNVDKVLNALSRLKDTTDFNYTVIGDGEFKTQLETKARQLGLADNVNFIGRQSTQKVIDAMMNSDLFLLPSSTLADSHEGFGIVYLEAAACGTPSLATRQAGAVEAIEDGVSGFFVEEPTVENIQEALSSFLTGKIRFDQNECRAFAERFTWNKVVDHALPYYLAVNKP